MADSKKFVAGFLLLAAVVSSLAFVFSGFSDNEQSKNAQQPAIADSQTPQVPSNAFIEQIPQNSPIAENARNARITDADLPPVAASTNLTENFAQNMAREIIRKNPNGPQTADDGAGNPSPLQLPNASNLYGLISKNPGLKDIKIPNWDDQLAQIETKTIDNYTQEDVINYNDKLNSITEKYLVGANVSELSDINSPANDPNYAARLTNNAILELSKLQTPKPLTEFQKDFIKLLVYQKNGLNLLQVAQTDPMKASLVFQAHDEKYNLALNNIQNEIQRIQNLQKTSSKQHGNALSVLLENVFSIKKAHALFFGLIVFDPAAFHQKLTKDIWDKIRNAILQILKNTLVSIIQNQITQWINGDFGKPQFITNWRYYLSNTYNQVAGAAIDEVVPGLCQPFQLRIKSRLKLIFDSKNVNVSCTLDRVLGNINNTQNFFNNFAAGGWKAYGATLLPTGNEEGSLLISLQTIDKKAKAAQEAAKNKAIAGQGYKGTGTCKNGKPADINGLCSDGSDAIVTTPGATSAKIIGDSADSNVKLIVSANDIIGIAAAAGAALISRLTASGSGGLSSVGEGEIVGSGGAPILTPPQTTCNPTPWTTSPNVPTVFAATGGDGLTYAWSAPSGAPTSGTGPTFSVSFPSLGTSTVSVTGSDGVISVCAVSVQQAQ